MKKLSENDWTVLLAHLGHGCYESAITSEKRSRRRLEQKGFLEKRGDKFRLTDEGVEQIHNEQADGR